MFTALIRTVILYILIIAGVRLMGKRQVGELEPSELVLSLLIADLASVPMQDLGIPLHAGVVPILALLSLTMILSVLTMKSIRFRTLMCGRPSIVVRDGKVDQGEMRRNRLTVDELLEELRGQGYTDLAGVKYGILETNGRLSVLPYAEQRPATARQLGLESRETGLPVVIISDGRILQDNLKRRGLDLSWLDKQLAEMKRLWAAVGILAALLAAALGTGWWVDGLTADYVSRLEQAQAMSERGDWERAAQVTGGVYRNWQERSFWLHALLRHSDTDQVLLLFRSVEEYLKLEEMDQYAAANAQLIAQLELLAEMEDPSLENVL